MTREKEHRCATARESIKQAEPGDPAVTHILMKFDSKPQEDLYRADGMLVASRQSDMVRFGHDIATAQSRLFLNERTASAFLRLLADVDLIAAADGVNLHERVNGYATAEQLAIRLNLKASIEVRNAETLLTVAGPGKVLHN